jgi:hypothetical protein
VSFSIKKKKYFRIRDFLFDCNVYFVIISIFCSISFADKSPISVREFKFYREFIKGDLNFVVNKKTQSIVAVRRNMAIKFNKQKNSKIYSFSKNLDNKSHYIYFDYKNSGKKLIGYIRSDSGINYKAEACEKKACIPTVTDLKKKAEELVSDKIMEQIEKLKISNLFDKDSCSQITPSQFEEFKEVLQSALDTRRNYLFGCFNSTAAQSFFNSDEALRENSDEVLTRYLNLINAISNGSSGLKLKCGLNKGDESKVASFSQDPLVISLNLINSKFNLGIENIESAINHELLHMGMQQFRKDSNIQGEKTFQCLDEGFVQLFENVCDYKPENKGPSPVDSSKIVGGCLAGKIVHQDTQEQLLKNTNSAPPDSAFEVVVSEISGQGVVAQQINSTVTNNLQNEINTNHRVAFEPVADTDTKAVATADLSTVTGQSIRHFEGDGEVHQVVADSGFTDSYNRIQTSLSNSFNNSEQLLTTALGAKGAAVATIMGGSRAIASTGAGTSGSAASGSSGDVGVMTATQIYATRYLPSSDGVQNIIDDPKLDSLNYADKEKYFASLGSGTPSVATASQKSLKADSQRAPQVTIAAGKTGDSAQNLKTGGATGARGIASVGAAVPVALEAPSVKEAGEDPALKQTKAGSATTGTLAQPPVPARLDNQIIQRLAAFSDINEPAYSRVVERFKDATFRQQLSARKIQIFNENGKPLWTSTTKPEKCFKDTKVVVGGSVTKVLKQTSCR